MNLIRINMNATRNLAILGTMLPIAVFAQSNHVSSNFAQSDKNSSNLNDTTLMLQEVTIKSTLPKTRVKGDALRTIVNGTILEKAGSCTDVLNRIPQLKADKDGGVEVFGRGDAEVYINGRKVQDLKELSRIQSDQIKTVDVVQNPGARYAASVKAVVRITLRKAKGEGWSFIEKASMGYHYGTAADNNLDLNYRHGGLDVTGSFWAGYDYANKYFQENILNYQVGEHQYRGESHQNSHLKWRGWSPQIQVNYMIDENHSLGAYYKFDNHPWQTCNGWLNTDSYEDGKYRELSESKIYQQIIFKKHIFNAYYNGKVGKLGIDLNIDGLFDVNKEPNGTEENITDADGNKSFSKVDNFTKSQNRFWASKLVFSYPVWQGSLTVGGEYSHNNRSDAYSYQSESQLPMANTDTRIKESMAAGFIEYGRRFGSLFAQIGVRYEYLNTGYYEYGDKQDDGSRKNGGKQEDVSRKYGDWFPTAALSLPIGKVQLSLSYRQDIKRPEYSNLTSSTIYINRYAYQTGNPYLKPTYSHVLLLNAAYQSFNLVVNYSHTKDVVALLTEPYPGSDDPLLSIIHPVNASDGYDKWVINPSFRPTIGKWHPLWSVGWIAQNYKTLTASGEKMTMNRPFWQLVWNNDVELPAHFRLNAFAQVRTKGDYDNLRFYKTSCNIGLGVQRDFNLRSLGSLTADLRCNDIFNTNKSGVTMFGARELSAYNPSRRYFSLDITWKFNEARSKYRGTGAGQEQKARM
mgnify:FL=1